MRVAIATVLVALLIVLAGCPGTDGGGGAEPAADQEEGAGTVNDNDAGAEPRNPQNGTDAAGNGTDDGFAGMTETANESVAEDAEDEG